MAGIDWADALVAITDGSDPDSGTAWECGYAYGKKPIILVRTDIRAQGSAGPYYAMLAKSATIRLDRPFAPVEVVAADLLDAMGRLNTPAVAPVDHSGF